MIIPSILVLILSALFMFEYKEAVQSTVFTTLYFIYFIFAIVGLGCSDNKEGILIIKY